VIKDEIEPRGMMMRDHWLNLRSILGVASMLFIAQAGFAQAQTAMPPAFTESPAIPLPDDSRQAPAQAPPSQSAAPPSAPAQVETPAEPATPTQPEAEKTPAPPPAAAKPTAAKPKTAAKPVKSPKSAASARSASPARARAVAKSRMPRKSLAARNPRDIVAAIYDIAAGKDGSYAGPSAFTDRTVRQLYFSKDLQALLRAMDAQSAKIGEPILKFDPLANGDQADVQDLDIEIETQNANEMTVAAKFRSTYDSSIVHYDFVMEGRGWKIDDIRGEIQGQSGQWSLREIINNGLKKS
jgi:outer membrane biosynthesis protein TonB